MTEKNRSLWNRITNQDIIDENQKTIDELTTKTTELTKLLSDLEEKINQIAEPRQTPPKNEEEESKDNE